MPTDIPDSVVSSLADTAALLAGFGFTGFVLVVERLGGGPSSADKQGRADPSSADGTAAFLLGAAFVMGLLASFLWTTSHQQPTALRDGFLLGAMAFAMMFMAFGAAVVSLVTQHIAEPGPRMAWWVGAGAIGFAFVRASAEFWMALDVAVLDSRSLALIALTVAAPAATLLIGRRTELIDDSQQRPNAIVGHASLKFSGFFLAVGLAVALLHTAIVVADLDELPLRFPTILALQACLGATGAWALRISRPEEVTRRAGTR